MGGLVVFIALNANNEKVSIENADKICEYFCPVCNEKLSIKATNSLSVRAHFAHKKGTECLDDWKHDMSEWHYNWQCQFPEEYREVVVEKDEKKHRADVLINGYVIEFQHSPISRVEIKERNEFYTNCGYKVIWVFDANDKIKNKFDNNGSIDPARLQARERLEWKRARAEFKDQTCKNVFYFIEYNTDIFTNPPQNADIMLYLTEMHPKEIEYLPTIFPINNKLRYNYLLKDYFVKSFWLIKDNDNVMSAFEIIDNSQKYKQTLENQKKRSNPRTQYNISKSNMRKFRF